MRVQNDQYRTKWYSAIVGRTCKPIEGSERVLLEPVYGYRFRFIREGGYTPEEQKKEQEKWEKRRVHTTLKTMDHDEEGLSKGTLFLEVSSPKSIVNLERYWEEKYGIKLDGKQFEGLEGKSYPVFDENEIRSQSLLDFKTQSDWERVVVSGREAWRINLERLSTEAQEKLFQNLRKFGISEEHLRKAQRFASFDTDLCKEGDRTLRLVYPADLERWGRLFDKAERPNAKWEWRNLSNWMSKDIIGQDGKAHVNFMFNMDDLSDIQSNHMKDVLADLGVEYSERQLTLKSRQDRSYLCVTGEKNLKILRDFTKPWTREKHNTREKER